MESRDSPRDTTLTPFVFDVPSSVSIGHAFIRASLRFCFVLWQMSYQPVAHTTAEPNLKTLRSLHLMAAIWHGCQCAALFGVVDSTFAIPIELIEHDVWNRSTHLISTLSRKVIFDLPVLFLPPIFIALAAIDHGVTFIKWNSGYADSVRRGVAYFRWVEYSFSAALMNVNILVLSNGVDIYQLVAVFILTSTCMFFGAAAEFSDASSSKFGNPFIWMSLGFVPFVGAWSIIVGNFTSSIRAPPDFVYLIIVVLVLLELTFAANLLLRLCRTSTKRFRDAELGWIFLSVTSKTFLAWIQYQGASSLRG
jgi:hypothetical protein